MRKSVSFILLATAAMPALAADGPKTAAIAAPRAQSGASAPTATSRSGRTRGAQRTVREPRQDVSGRAHRARASDDPRAERREAPRPSGRSVAGLAAESTNRRTPVVERQHSSRRRTERQSERAVNRDSTDSVTNWRARERRAGRSVRAEHPGDSRQRRRRQRRAIATATARLSGSGTNWRHSHPVMAGRRRPATRSGSWRRPRPRRPPLVERLAPRRPLRLAPPSQPLPSLFRLGFYYDPFGWAIAATRSASRCGRAIIGNSYWLNDPWQYRLPPAYGPYRWIRYYDDALLVDI